VDGKEKGERDRKEKEGNGRKGRRGAKGREKEMRGKWEGRIGKERSGARLHIWFKGPRVPCYATVHRCKKTLK